MSEYVIMTDNTVDMPLSWFQENQVDYLCLSWNMSLTIKNFTGA